jgi:hypothetical protein
MIVPLLELPENARRAEEHYPTHFELSDKKTTCNGIWARILVHAQVVRTKDNLPQGRG